KNAGSYEFKGGSISTRAGVHTNKLKGMSSVVIRCIRKFGESLRGCFVSHKLKPILCRIDADFHQGCTRITKGCIEQFYEGVYLLQFQLQLDTQIVKGERHVVGVCPRVAIVQSVKVDRSSP